MIQNRPLIDVWHYFVGNYRYKLYYSKRFKWLIRPHIAEQILYRITLWMDKECYNRGQCKICECETTALQMCNKSCDKPCYPEMMDSFQWGKFKILGMKFDKKRKSMWELKPDRTLKLFDYKENKEKCLQ